MIIIENKSFDEERALYNTQNAIVQNCRFEGEADGESFLKESRNIEVKNCFMDLRYPMWHIENLKIENCEMTERCRAALWYDTNVTIVNTIMNGIKALRECSDITLDNINGNSPEFGWRCKNIQVKGGKLSSEYLFFESENIHIENLEFSGKYSFQYTKDVTIYRSNFKTKDAFWHARNVMVRNSVLEGEYIGWYSDGLTLVNCLIKGTQPFCYCKNLKLVNCTLVDCDLAFEYSDVDATIMGDIVSIKNPKSGRIVADGYGQIILSGSKYECKAEIIERRISEGCCCN